MTKLTFEFDDEQPLNRALWQELVYIRDGLTCTVCEKKPYGETIVRPKRGHAMALDAHHINGDNTDHRLANGQCVCNSCHARITMTGRKRVLTERYYEAIRNRPKPKPLSAESRAKISEKARVRCADPKFAQGMSERTRARWQDPEFRAKARAGMARAHARRKGADA